MFEHNYNALVDRFQVRAFLTKILHPRPGSSFWKRLRVGLPALAKSANAKKKEIWSLVKISSTRQSFKKLAPAGFKMMYFCCGNTLAEDVVRSPPSCDSSHHTAFNEFNDQKNCMRQNQPQSILNLSPLAPWYISIRSEIPGYKPQRKTHFEGLCCTFQASCSFHRNNDKTPTP